MPRLTARSLLARSSTFVSAAFLTSAAAFARPVEQSALPVGSDMVLTLDNDDVIKGRILSTTADAAVIEHPVLGAVTIPLARISVATVTSSPEEAKQVAAEAAKAVAPPPPPPATPEEAKLTFWEGWKGSVELGLSGSDGNTETFSGRGGFRLERLTDEMESRFTGSYSYATDNGEKSRSRGELFFRNDWSFKDSPWGFFAQGRAEYDEFQDWNWRLSAFAGPTYTLIRNDTTLLRLRAGAGVTQELGGSDDDLVPEALFGVDFSHKFTEHQSLFVNYEYLPSFENFTDYRMVTRAGYEIMIDPDSGLSLRLGLENRYDSDPASGQKKSDLDYFALLAWNF